MSGSKHYSHVTGYLTEKGKYDPSVGSFNFAVPNIKTLLRHQKKVNKFVQCGILNGAFDILDNMKQFVLEYDAKRLASGLSPDGYGDINLWGYENPQLEKNRKELEEEIEIIERLSTLEDKYNESLFLNLIDLIHNISKRIEKKQYSIQGHKKYLKDLQKMCSGNVKLMKKYNKANQDTKAKLFLLQNWIEDALKLNKSICYILGEINKTINNMPLGNTVEINKQRNVKLLHNPEKLGKKWT